MRPGPDSHLRLARPSRDLAAAEHFWVHGLGLEALWRSQAVDAEGGHALLMLGWPDAAWHLEFVGDPNRASGSEPSEEHLLVLYLGGQVDADVEQRLLETGGRHVRARNPYWDRWGTTIADPDGYRLVLSHRTWS
jgi:catechol 2,3-dioxygenase-like lactoylglutathione lyase family enzyme